MRHRDEPHSDEECTLSSSVPISKQATKAASPKRVPFSWVRLYASMLGPLRLFSLASSDSLRGEGESASSPA